MQDTDIKARADQLVRTWKYIKVPNEQKLGNVKHVEVIDSNGRAYVNLNAKNVRLSYQDDGRTLKVFID